MQPTFRILTVICFFLPFTFFCATCNDGIGLRFSYNQPEADKNILLETKNREARIAPDTAAHSSSTVLTDTETETLKSGQNLGQANTVTSGFNELFQTVMRKIIMPTDRSLSGIGTLFYFKNIMGKVLVAVSLSLSVLLLFLFKFLKRSKLGASFLLLNVSLVTAFVIDCLISGVTLLWGVWLLGSLLLIQSVFLVIARKAVPKV
jgi:hypothetical protein